MEVQNLDNCPSCSKSWIGEPIPEESRKYFGNNTHFNLLIGIEYTSKYDGVSEWMCPFCLSKWNRFTGEKIR